MQKNDISNELSRTYHYAGGESITIGDPKELWWKRDEDGDSHRVVTKSGEVHCPRRGWLSVSWDPSDKENPIQF